MSDIPFGTTDWDKVERTEKPAEAGKAYWARNTVSSGRTGTHRGVRPGPQAEQDSVARGAPVRRKAIQEPSK